MFAAAEPAHQRERREQEQGAQTHRASAPRRDLPRRERGLEAIAQALTGSSTVRNQVSAILDALGVESRGHAIVLAREAGYGQ